MQPVDQGCARTRSNVIPREQKPIFGGFETRNAVKGCWVSTCLEHHSAQLLGGLPRNYAAEKKWRPFFQNGCPVN